MTRPAIARVTIFPTRRRSAQMEQGLATGELAAGSRPGRYPVGTQRAGGLARRRSGLCSCAWDDNDVRIDAVAPRAARPRTATVRAKESRSGRSNAVSNHEVAHARIAVSTWNAYKSDGQHPASVAMLCRAAQRDLF